MLEAEIIKLTSAVVDLTAAIKNLHENYSPLKQADPSAVLFPTTPQTGRPRHPSVDELLVALQEMNGIFEDHPDKMREVVRNALENFGAERIGDLKYGAERMAVLKQFREAATVCKEGGYG